MKYQERKSYGHPVLRSSAEILSGFENEFDGNFFFEKDFKKDAVYADENFVNLPIDVSVTEPVMKQLIDQGKISVTTHVYCPRTSFVLSHLSTTDAFLVPVPKSEINVDLVISYFLIANDSFTVSSNNIHSDFGYNSYSVEKGDVLGQAPPDKLQLDKDPIQKDYTYILKMTELDRIEEGHYELETETKDGRVDVKLNPTFKNDLMRAQDNKTLETEIVTSFFIPIFTELYSILEHELEEPEAYENEVFWKRVLLAKLEELGLEPEDGNSKLAQMTFENPMKSLSKTWRNKR